MQGKKPAGPDKAGFYWGTGRRKTAVARVRIKPGTGKISINKRELTLHFTEMRDLADVAAPLKATKTEGALDVHITVNGGGFTGQAGACKLGIARALLRYDVGLEPILREHDFLTRDARKVERKKYGQSGARRRFQFSKR
ncbi:MAG: 30S ribosomal protein S9 [Planctomycetota bacterium]|nr:30S ribosomal protein S9 [Planctomycetota bacterium]